MFSLILNYFIITFFIAILYTITNFGNYADMQMDVKYISRKIFENWKAGHLVVINKVKSIVADKESK